ncbi:DUF2514 family protein [Pseudomonas sp.]|uniref:DUF2514 family protein n=1 Tax=Pseudomonas sp. TaxID=306 RepID=UPI003A96B89C
MFGDFAKSGSLFQSFLSHENIGHRRRCKWRPTPSKRKSSRAAKLLQRADKRAGELAAAYDRVRIAGLTCEAAYTTIKKSRLSDEM